MVAGPSVVSAIAVASAMFAPGYSLPLCAFMGLGFVLLAAFAGPRTVLAGVIVGTLELALVLPGDGFAVSDAQDALGLIATLAVGLVAAWFARRESRRIAALSWDLLAMRNARDQSRALLGELSHRLANDFAMLVASTTIMARSATNEETRTALNDIGDRIAVLGRVYNRFRITERDDDVVALADYLHELCDDLSLARFSIRPIALRLDIADIRLPLRRAIVVGIITNELLTNVYKHAFPEDRAGTATVTLARHPFFANTLCLTVADNGVGFARPIASGNSVGHRLMVGLAAQLGGAITFARNEEQTLAVVRFPLGPDRGLP